MFKDMMNFIYSLKFTEDMEKYSENDYYFPKGKIIENQGEKTHFLYYPHPDKKKNSLIFLHGIMVNSNVWLNYIHHFEEKYTIYALDFLGHGKSYKKPDLSLVDLVKQTQFLIEKENIQNPILIGHSLGGLVAGIYTAFYPEKVSRLVIMSSIDYDDFINDILNFFSNQILELMYPFMNSFSISFIMNALIKKIYQREVSLMYEEKMDSFLYHIKIKGFQRSLFSLMKNHSYPGFSSSLFRNIICPVQIIHGEKDRLVDYYHAEKIASFIPHAELIAIKNGSHMIIEENQDFVIQCIENFLEKTPTKKR